MYDIIYHDIITSFRRNSRPKSWYVTKELYPKLVEEIYRIREEIHMPVYFEFNEDIVIPDEKDFTRPGVMLGGIPIYPEPEFNE